MSASTSASKRIAVICVAAALVLGGGGVAFAYWSSTGTGTGTATTGTSAEFSVTSIAAVGSPLVPDGDAQTVGFTVANPSDASLNLASVVVTIANADGSTWIAVPGCSAADYVVSAPVIVYGAIAGSSSVDGTVDVTMIDTGVAQDACKDASVPLYFVAN